MNTTQLSGVEKGSLTTEVMNAIRAKVASRALAAGDRLPSIRSLATTMGVSTSTVVEAYDRLVAEGLIRAKRGSGFYVSALSIAPLALADARPKDRAIDPFWVSRQSLDADPDSLKPGCGWLPDDWLPIDALRRGLRGIARNEPAVISHYGNSYGSLALRRILAARLADEGLDISTEQILLSGSGTQAIDLICRFLLRPGETVLVDDPCYFNFHALLRAHQANIVGVPYTPSGPDIASFAELTEKHRPRLYVTNSALHNPTGASLSLQTAHRLLNIATQYDLTIVEDDIFADFEPEPSARLSALDGLNRVIRVGSFSKTLSASLRCGYIATRSDWVTHLADLQIAICFGGPSPVAAELIANVLAGGSYRKHMEELRRRLTRARRDTAEKLYGIGIEPWLMPRGGFYLWCRLPDGCDSSHMAQAALKENVVLAPGNVFSVSQTAAAFMRFNVAQCSDQRLMPLLRRLIDV